MTGIKKKELGIGIFLLVTFAAVMVMIFMPILDGGNALNYLDNLYNSISKGTSSSTTRAPRWRPNRSSYGPVPRRPLREPR